MSPSFSLDPHLPCKHLPWVGDVAFIKSVLSALRALSSLGDTAFCVPSA